MVPFWKDKKILVTGGAGFLGSYIVRGLLAAGAQEKDIVAPRSAEHDLRERSACRELAKGMDIIIHAAVTGGGIGFNRAHPGQIFYDNIIMSTELMEAARLAGVKKFVGIGTICSYPKLAPVPFREENLWDGYPEETNGSYGLSKKMMLVQAKAYFEEYGFMAISPLFENMYGPGDDFNPESSHVIPALIKKISDAQKAGAPSIPVWGTGRATRGFLYVEDAAQAVIKLAENYDDIAPINIASEGEISIRDLVVLIARLMNYEGQIAWDSSKPDGQPKRSTDGSRALSILGFKPAISFEEGLQRTIAWYKENKA